MNALFRVSRGAFVVACLLHPGQLPPFERTPAASTGDQPLTGAAGDRAGAASAATHQEPDVKNRASGEFDVKITPQPPDDYADGKTLGRSWIDKTFRGDLAGTSRGQMLTALTDVKGSAGYVAIEKVAGTLGGRRGTFVLQHSGTMARGTQQLALTVVPDSGTDQLVGLAGEMRIEIADGRHSYVFEYTLATRGEL